MVVAYEAKSGLRFIGYAGEMMCHNCSNKSDFLIRQYVLEQKLYWVVPAGTHRGPLYLCCPVCEDKNKILSPNVFSKSKDFALVHDHLSNGMLKNISYFINLPKNQRSDFLGALNKLHAYEVVKTLGEVELALTKR
jgi:hypothetical protein